MGLIGGILAGIVVIAIVLWLLSFFAGAAELAWQFWPKKGEKTRDYVTRIGGWLLGLAMTLAGVVGIIGALTARAGAAWLPKLGFALGGLLIAVVGVLLFMRNSKPE